MVGKWFFCAVGLSCLCLAGQAAAQGTVGGDLIKWHTVSIDFQGPSTSEAAATNPFTDYRLDVTFTHVATGKTYVVPGFFDGNGTGSGTGNVWRTRFTPDEPGAWSYTAAFRTGSNVAVADSASLGSFATTGPHGQSGNFSVADLDPNAKGFKAQGRLEYVGGHYLKFRDGDYWLKGGADSPENILGYSGFDNTPNFRHQYAAHAGDWNSGDPDWTNDAPNGSGTRTGKNIIGALNYLSQQHVNSIYFLPMNIGGDAKDTWPYVGPINRSGSSSNDNTRFDISKLAQWEIVFNHAQEKGLNLQVVLNEAEVANKQELDNATLGVERKLFYREMIARFGHHNALQWNISEEYNALLNLGENTVRQFADFITSIDPYHHPITVHNAGNNLANTWYKFLGEDRWSLTSIQQAGVVDGLGLVVEDMRTRSANAGHPLVIMIDEPGSIDVDAGGADNVRKRMTWDIYLSGGSVEWFTETMDQSLENFRQFEQVYRETWYARQFLEQNTRFWEMTPMDSLVAGEDPDFGGAEVFAILGQQYAIYLPDGSNDDYNGGAPILDLTGWDGATFQLKWYNPRSGTFVGNPLLLTGGDWVSLGFTPDGLHSTNDWAALVTLVPEPASFSLLFAGLLTITSRPHRHHRKTI